MAGQRRAAESALALATAGRQRQDPQAHGTTHPHGGVPAAVGRGVQPDSGLVITSDMIVGFPGETQADFEESLRFVEEMRFAHVHVFPYSARDGTAAAGFSGEVPAAERRERVDAMEAVARGSRRGRAPQFPGTIRPVLWEALEHPANGTGALWSGLTDNYLRVQAIAPAGEDMENRITPARLVELCDGVIKELRSFLRNCLKCSRRAAKPHVVPEWRERLKFPPFVPTLRLCASV